MTDWDWIGTDGRSKRGISELRAKSLVAIYGGEAVESLALEPLGLTVAKPVVLPAIQTSSDGADAFYGVRGRYNGD